MRADAGARVRDGPAPARHAPARPAGHRVARRGRGIGVLQERDGAGLGGVIGELLGRAGRQQLGDRERRRHDQRRDGDELDRGLAGLAARAWQAMSTPATSRAWSWRRARATIVVRRPEPTIAGIAMATRTRRDRSARRGRARTTSPRSSRSGSTRRAAADASAPIAVARAAARAAAPRARPPDPATTACQSNAASTAMSGSSATSSTAAWPWRREMDG